MRAFNISGRLKKAQLQRRQTEWVKERRAKTTSIIMPDGVLSSQVGQVVCCLCLMLFQPRLPMESQILITYLALFPTSFNSKVSKWNKNVILPIHEHKHSQMMMSVYYFVQNMGKYDPLSIVLWAKLVHMEFTKENNKNVLARWMVWKRSTIERLSVKANVAHK